MNNNKYIEESCLQRQKTVYARTYERNIPSQNLQPYLNARPSSTKYSLLPIVDPRTQSSTPFIQEATYNQEKIFNPGNTFAPWSGYASNINNESELRNQIYALQKNDQSVYVPSSKSSLYQIKWNNLEKINQPFPDLFQTPQFDPVNKNINSDRIGYALFNNATRQQTKNLTKETKC
jgi:hypothetical protein